MNTFFAMGGYAIYVWPAFAVFFVVLLADYMVSGFRRRRTLREVRAKLKRQQTRSRSNLGGRDENPAAPGQIGETMNQADGFAARPSQTRQTPHGGQ